MPLNKFIRDTKLSICMDTEYVFIMLKYSSISLLYTGYSNNAGFVKKNCTYSES